MAPDGVALNPYRADLLFLSHRQEAIFCFFIRSVCALLSCKCIRYGAGVEYNSLSAELRWAQGINPLEIVSSADKVVKAQSHNTLVVNIELR